MKYWHMIAVDTPSNSTDVTHTTSVDVVDEAGNENQNSVNEKLDMMTDILSIIKQQTSGVYSEETNLDEKQVSEIIDFILIVKDKYFSDIPLSTKLTRNFIWNIPEEVYKAFRNAQDYMRPDILNPIILFYIFCTDCPDEAMGKFITILVNLAANSAEDIWKMSEEWDNQFEDEDDIEEGEEE